jgi:hypothetical protein
MFVGGFLIGHSIPMHAKCNGGVQWQIVVFAQGNQLALEA